MKNFSKKNINYKAKYFKFNQYLSNRNKNLKKLSNKQIEIELKQNQ